MRPLSPDVLAVLSGPVVPMALLLDLQFDPPVRLCSGAVDLEWAAATYKGTGALGAVEPVQDEVQGLTGLRFALSGVPPESLALALGEQVRGTPCVLRLAILHPETHQVLDAPSEFAGTLDQMPITHGVQTSSIGVIAVHRHDTYRRPKPLRYTDGDQQRLHPGDTSMRYVVSQSQVQDVWPSREYFER